MKKSLFFLLASAVMLASCTDKDDNLGSSLDDTAQDNGYNNPYLEQGYPNEAALKVGDISPDGLGVVFWVDPTDNTKGKAISIEVGEGLAFDAAADLTAYSITSPVNGALNCRDFYEVSDGILLEAINFATEIGDYWYLPASDELVELFEIYNGTTVSNTTIKNPAYITAEEIEARASFDAMLEAAGARAMNTADVYTGGDYYWSSTERDNDRKAVRYTRFGSYISNYDYKNETTALVRGMQIIGSYDYLVEERFVLDEEVYEFDLAQAVGDGDTISYYTTVDLSKISYTCDADWLDISVTDTCAIFTTNTSNEAMGESKTRFANLTLSTGDYSYSFEISQKPADFVVEGYPNKKPLAVGQLTPDSLGMVFWVDSLDNTCGKAISLTRALRSFDTANQENTFYWTLCGLETTELFKEKAEDVTTLQAINFCDSIGDFWYMPSLDEMLEVFEVYNGRGTDTTTVAVPDLILPEEMAARESFDIRLKLAVLESGILAADSLGIDTGAMNQAETTESGDLYWTASEDPGNSTRAEYIRFGQYTQSGNTKNTEYYVRGMQIIGTYTFKVE